MIKIKTFQIHLILKKKKKTRKNLHDLSGSP